MRLIGSFEDTGAPPVKKEGFVNISSFNAAGFKDTFTANVRGAAFNNAQISFDGIPNYSTIESYMQVGTELQAFFYLDTTVPEPSTYSNFIINLAANATGVISSTAASTKAPLTYFIFAYDAQTGTLSPYKSTITIADVFLNPRTEFDADRFVTLSFTRRSNKILPLVFRRWGTTPTVFLSAVSNNVLGGNDNTQFVDRGSSDVPSWDEADSIAGRNFPEFLKGLLTFDAAGTPIIKTLVSKRRLRVVQRNTLGAITCVDVVGQAPFTVDERSPVTKLILRFDDTKPIRDAIDFALTQKINEIFIPAGTYYVRNLPIVTDGLTIRGSGQNSIIKKMSAWNGGTGDFGLMSIKGSSVDVISGINVNNVCFDGNKNETFSVNLLMSGTFGVEDKYNTLLYAENAQDIKVSDCAFYNACSTAIYVLSADGVFIKNNTVTGCSKPYELDAAPLMARITRRLIAQSNLFENCSGPVNLLGLDLTIVNTNIISNCGETGISLQASDTWSAQGNLALNSSGSVIRSVDLYQNEYSRVSLDIKKGVSMIPTYFTVTDGGLPVGITYNTIEARVYQLDSDQQFILPSGPTPQKYYLQVLQSLEQLNVGIFGITAPVNSFNIAGDATKVVLGTSSYNTIFYDKVNPANNRYGYGYQIIAMVALGSYQLRRIQRVTATTVKIFFKTADDFLRFTNFPGANQSNDQIKTTLVRTSINGWPDDQAMAINSLDNLNSALIVNTPDSVKPLFPTDGTFFEVTEGRASIIRDNYLIADGNIFVSQ